MRSVEDTLYQVQKMILNDKTVISKDLLADIEQHLTDYAVVCRGAEELKKRLSEVTNNVQILR